MLCSSQRYLYKTAEFTICLRFYTSLGHLTAYTFQYGGNPVSCAIGLAVLDVIRKEEMMSSAKYVGMMLLEGFRDIQPQHPMMGDVRYTYINKF